METIKDIEPTGTCFEDVTIEFARQCRAEPYRMTDARYRMVHGICVMPSGRRFAHAWIEDGKEVWFSGIIDGQFGFACTTRKDFYAAHRVQEVTRYTFHDLMELAKTVGNMPPPWKPEYRLLCRDGGAPLCQERVL